MKYEEYLEKEKKRYELAEQIQMLDGYLNHIRSGHINCIKFFSHHQQNTPLIEEEFSTDHLKSDKWKSLIEIFILDWRESLIKEFESL